MRYHVSITAYLAKKQGNFDGIYATYLELQNLLTSLTIDRDQLHKLKVTYQADKDFKIESDFIKEAEIADAILTGEWRLYMEHKVSTHIISHLFKKIILRYLSKIILCFLTTQHLGHALNKLLYFCNTTKDPIPRLLRRRTISRNNPTDLGWKPLPQLWETNEQLLHLSPRHPTDLQLQSKHFFKPSFYT